ncbi:MAG TPA: YceI family protein [Chitinophagales bacterium]|nr:YceI family protein [Chitinophagales bacterium]
MSTQASTKWAIDAAHSEIGFKAKHLMISTVKGKFDKFEGQVETNGDDFTTANISFTADVASINTGNADRDGHLKSADFFNAEKFPQLKFTDGKLTLKSGSEYTLTGNLTVRDVTKPVTLDVEYAGTAKDPWGNTKAGFTINGKINRTEFGLNWNVALETGGWLVSEEIKIIIDAQLLKQA